MCFNTIQIVLNFNLSTAFKIKSKLCNVSKFSFVCVCETAFDSSSYNYLTVLFLQLEYYKQEKVSDFVQILETARTEANLEYSNHEKDQVCVVIISDVVLILK